jgi:hypothetical protein
MKFNLKLKEASMSSRQARRSAAMRLTGLAAVILMCVGIGAQAQVLEQVPAESLVVVKVANLQATSGKVAKLMHDLGIDAMAPQMQDPLGAFQQHLKANAGLDKSGEMAFVFVDPAAADNQPDESMLILLPVTDYKAFLGNFPDAQTDGGVSQIHFGDQGKPGFCANWGKYAAISPGKSVVGLKPAGIKAQGVSAKEIASKDIIAYVNMPKVREKVQPMLPNAKTKFQEQVEQGLAKDENAQKYAPLLKLLVSEVMDAGSALINDGQAVTYGLGFEDQGIRTSVVLEFNQGSSVGNYVTKVKNTDQPMLNGLPAGKYLFYGGGIAEPEIAKAFITTWIDPLVAEAGKLGGDQAAAAQKFDDAVKKYVSALKSQSMGWMAPSGALGQDPIMQTVSVQRGDTNAIRSAFVDMSSAQQDITKAFSGGQEQMKTSVTPNGKTVDGVQFDQMTSTFNPAANGPGAAQAQMIMNYFYGPNGMQMLIGTVGDKVLVTSGINDQALSSAINSAKTDEDNLSKLPGVQTVSAQLPKQRCAAVFVPLDQIVNTIATYAAAMGMNMQVQLPPDLPPIGATVATDGTAIRIDSYTPTELIKAVTAAGMQVFMQMQGGRQPGGPGGL